jgi:RHS repeat-associated protein
VADRPNRPPDTVSANRYLKRIHYGNRTPYFPTMHADEPEPALPTDWLFELVFDYGDHDGEYPTPVPDRRWPCRPDPFSRHRAGFEVRTYRRCQRVLMYHHIPEDPAVGIDCLVKATEFGYAGLPADQRDPTGSGYTLLADVTHRSVAADEQGNQHSRRMPPVGLRYSRSRIAEAVAVPAAKLPNLPAGISGDGYRWVDLDGEGLCGVLADDGGAWHYQPNRGGATFGPVHTVARRPALALLAPTRQQLVDLAGDGRVDLVDFGPPTPGYATRTGDGWSDFAAFAALPNLDWAADSLRFVDLTGDGRADALITDQDGFTWFASRGAAGFDAATQQRVPGDERDGPRVVFQDGTQSVFLADMCGDGLTDLVRIRDGEVCYWPNLGYGRFGRRVLVGNAPRFPAGSFDPARVRLADVDGSGPTDLLYLGADGVRLYLNRSGNVFTDPIAVAAPVATEDLASVQVVDLMGNGTGCLVWNARLPGDAGHPLRYLELTAPATPGNATRKPHLLVEVRNNLGASTEVEYTPSTEFYLRDLRAGRPWASVLPFPVACVSRVTLRDSWRGTAYTSTYSYHHGCYDGVEREFRGFGRVEQTDTERFAAFAAAQGAGGFTTTDETLYQPPIRTITWHHTGVDAPTLAGEYAAVPLPPATVTVDGPGRYAEVLRAAKGSVLRSEVYELDPSAEQRVRLMSLAQHSYAIRTVQRAGPNRHAVLLALETESVQVICDGNLSDPRTNHTLHLRHDEYGKPQQVVTVTYGRRTAGTVPGVAAALLASVQDPTHMSYVESRYTVPVLVRGAGDRAAIRHRRLPLVYEASTFELTWIAVPAAGYVDAALLRRHELCPDGLYPPVGAAVPVASLPYHRPGNAGGGGAPARRLVQLSRTYYYDDADPVASPTQSLPFGTHGPRGLTYETYLLALTTDLLDAVLTRDNAPLLDWPVTGGRTALDLLNDPAVGGYLRSVGPNGIGLYWLRSGQSTFAADARASFYLPYRFTDPFGATTRIGYDPLLLYVRERTDPAGNTSAVAEFDHRVLAPRALVDPNANRDQVVFDIFGLVVASGRLGKRVNGRWQGDDLSGFDFALANPAEPDVAAFCAANRLDRTTARRWLAGAGARFVYHFGDPATGAAPGVCTIARERYAGRLATGQTSPLTVSLEFADGLGRTLLRKAQAENDRWIVDGLVVTNNKGNPVMKYQPAFSDDFGFELPASAGPVEVLRYDGAGRHVRTDFPDGTFSLTRYTPWQVTTYDRNDTVLDSQWYAARRRYQPADRLPVDMAGITVATADERAAWLTARHADTPAVTVLDSLGREVVNVAHNRVEDPAGTFIFDARSWRDDYHVTVTDLDAESKPLRVRDANGTVVVRYVTDAGAPAYDLAGTQLFQHGADSGPRWTLHDAAGRPMLQWDANERVTDSGTRLAERRLLWTRHDALHRMVAQHLVVDDGPTAAPQQPPQRASALVEAVVYRDTAGLSQADLDRDRALNLIGQAVEHWDSAGRRTTRRVDLSGAPELVTRTLVGDDQAAVVDWSGNRTAALAAEEFQQITERDALGRTTRLLNWHLGAGRRVAVYQPRYNARGLLVAEDLTVGATRDATGDGCSGGTLTTVIREIRYDAAGQRQRLDLGNGSRTTYEYDPATLRLVLCGTARTAGGANDLQELRYTYDPTGNVVAVRDGARNTIWFANQQVEPVNELAYDAAYRLTEASGRESASTGAPGDREGAWPLAPFPAPAALRRYTQRFSYDRAGNLLTVQHRAAGGGWTRNYGYAYQNPSQQPAAPPSNRLTRTWTGTGTWDATAPAERVTYRQDSHGNLANLANTAPALDLRWDWRDLLRALDLGGGGAAHYTYDGSRQRVRKRIDRGGVLEERIYLDGFEWYRRTAGGAVVEEIESHHLFDGDSRVLLVDDVRVANPAVPGPNGVRTRPQTLLRYQYGNRLGSTGTELDETGRLISHEEFHPYGTTAYRLLESATEVPAKRYRYTGMERDEESGLSYHGARYLSLSLARWLSADPTGISGGLNVFAYAAGNPLSMVDRTGRQPVELPARTTVGQARMTMQEAAAAIRDTWGWEDQKFAQQARYFYHQQFKDAYREKANEGMKLVFIVWAAMAIVVVAGVAGGLVEGALVLGAGGAEAAIGAKVAAAGVGGLVGGTVEVGLEQGLRAGIGERLLTQEEAGLRIGLGGAGSAVVVGGSEIAAIGFRNLKGVMSLGDDLGNAAAEGLLDGARLVGGSGSAGAAGGTAGGGAIPLLTNQQLIARAEALFVAMAQRQLQAAGRPVTQEAINAMKAWNTVAVLQGTVDGQVVTLVAINQSGNYKYLAQIASETGEQIVDPVVYFTVGPRGGFKLGHEHAEEVMYPVSNALGLEGPRAASSNPGCWECQWKAIEQDVLHVNPKTIDSMRWEKK